MGSAECPGRKHCPFGEKCFAERAKDKAAASKIVVTNLAYLMQDLLLRQRSDGAVSLLGEYEQLLIDEAHNLPDVATSALEDSIGESALIRLSHDLAGFLNDQARDTGAAEDVAAQAGVLWAALAARYAERNRGNRQADPVRLAARDILDLADRVTTLLETIETARTEVLAVKGLDNEDPAYVARHRLLRRCDDWHARISAILISEDDVRWLEENEITVRGTKEKRLFLRTAPLSAGPFLREVIWDDVPAVMLSATLATGRDRRTGQPDFSYLRQGCGLKPGEAIEFDAGTPFDFASQAMLYVPAKGLPEPSGTATQSWRVFAQQATEQLVRAADGNALLLYTSRANLNDAYERLAPAFRKLGLTVLKQDDAPTPELIRQLKGGRAVLFGLKSFFEGVDIQGDAVSLVVIDKLPFAVPTDVLVKARAEALVRRHGSWADFRMMTIPSMSLVLIQGTGRLIRHRDDRGVIAVLDPRLSSKSYGRQIIESLPPAKVTRDISDAVRFLEGSVG
jgi:ATP-dependent DNA helicase DinG